MKRITLGAAISLTSFALLGEVAFAGEWAPGLDDHNGAPEHARSACVYNGQDDPDLGDDFIWEQSPAGGRVQSGGQLIAMGAHGVELPPDIPTSPGVQGVECNPTAVDAF